MVPLSSNCRERSTRVLIADDSAVVRKRLVDLFGDLDDVEIVGEAEDARIARNMAEQLRPEVAILDVVMPEGSGIDVLRYIKSSNPATKVVILTNFVDDESRKVCEGQGADYFFDKSTEFEKVVAVLRGMASKDR